MVTVVVKFLSPAKPDANVLMRTHYRHSARIEDAYWVLDKHITQRPHCPLHRSTFGRCPGEHFISSKQMRLTAGALLSFIRHVMCMFKICSEIDSTTRLSLPNANALSFLLASTRDQLVPLLQIISEQYPVDTFTETWNAFCLFKELIDAGH